MSEEGYSYFKTTMMKIGCDLRILSVDSSYTQFIRDFVAYISLQKKDITFEFYVNTPTGITGENITEIITKYRRESMFNNFRFCLFLRQQKSDYLLSFDENMPMFYNGKDILFISSVTNLFYFNETRPRKKFFYEFFFKSSLNKTDTIYCFDKGTKDEINEAFDIAEEKITVLTPFFSFPQNLETPEAMIPVDVKARHNITTDYFIYDAGVGVNKNLERTVEAFEKLKQEKIDISLVILGDEVGKDLLLRQQIIDTGMSDRVFFLGKLKDTEEKYYYEQAKAVIYPPIYESFPFELSKAVFYGIQILASQLDTTKTIFAQKPIYFNQLSRVDITKAVKDYLSKDRKPDYSEIKETYTKAHCMEKFFEKIK